MSATVEARFAGGAVFVAPTTLVSQQPGVIVQFPGYQLEMFPEEAQRLGIALFGAAHDALKESDRWPDVEAKG